jgi:hypothetical protein
MPDFDNLGLPQEDEEVALGEDETLDGEQVTDDGHTSGGGSLGHDQPEKVRRDTPTRNAAAGEDMPGRNATGSSEDPVMPNDDATLKTKI